MEEKTKKQKVQQFTVKRHGMNFKIYVDREAKTIIGKFHGYSSNFQLPFFMSSVGDINAKTVCDDRDEFKVSVGAKIVMHKMLAQIKSMVIQYYKREIKRIENTIKFEKNPKSDSFMQSENKA